MRRLTEVENKARQKAWLNLDLPLSQGSIFEAGFIAGLEYQQAQIKAYQDYIAGRITAKELDLAILAEATQ